MELTNKERKYISATNSKVVTGLSYTEHLLFDKQLPIINCTCTCDRRTD